MPLRFFVLIFFSATLVALSSCSTLDRQSAAMLASPPNVERSHYLDQVPFIEQKVAQCGPATLAMVSSSAGRPIEVDELAKSVLTESKGGSLQSALIGGARRQGLMAIPISGFQSLVREVAAGNPVIALQNLGLSWIPKWHYVVVTGYDLDTKTLRIHSGPDKNKVISFKDFEIDWAPARFWGLVVVSPEKLSETGSEFDHVTSAAILENLKKTADAELAYLAILKRWPESLGAMLGLGNIYYSSARWGKAVAILKDAHRHHPESKAAKHNYDIALKRGR